MTSLNKYAKETAWAVMSKGVAFLFYYGLVFYLTRELKVIRWGEWSAIWAVLNIVLLTSDQGINVATKKFIAEARMMGNLPEVVRGTFLLRVVASLLYAGLFALVCAPLSEKIGQGRFLSLFFLALPLVALYGIGEYFKALFEALHRLKYTFIINAIEHVGKLLLVILLFRWSPLYSSFIVAFTFISAVIILVGFIISLKLVPGWLREGRARDWVLPSWQYSLPVFLMSIGGFVALEIDTVMIKAMKGDLETGIYSLAKQIVLYLPHLSLAISMGTLPALARSSREAEAQRAMYYRIVKIITGIYVGLSGFLLVFALYFLVPVFGSGYEASVTPLIVLIPFVLFNSLSIYSGNLLNYRGLAWMRALNMGVTIVLNIGLNWLWIPKHGAVGAAWASSLSYFPYFALNAWQAHRTLNPVAPKPVVL